MQDKWYYFGLGVIVAAAIFSLLSFSAPGGSIFSPQPATGLIVREAVRQDLDAAQKARVELVDYSLPFDGKDNLPGKIVYLGKDYSPKVVSYSELSEYSGVVHIQYLLSIGESRDGKFPVYFVSLGEGPFVEGVVVLDQAFPEGSQPFI